MERLPQPSPPTFLVGSREEAESAVAEEIAALVRGGGDVVLGLATGTTPVGVYRELMRAHREQGLSFARVTTFNLDEFLGLGPDHPASFRRFMDERFFAHVDVQRSRTHLPIVDGSSRVSRSRADEAWTASERAAAIVAANAYEDAIRSAGGIDLQILGIGRNGHIGFNEPGSRRDSRTRVVELHEETREDATTAFGGIERVPVRAITMGVATILDARRIRVLAFGAQKSAVVRRTLLEPVSERCPSTFLRGHGDVRLFLDREAASELEVH